MGAWARKGARLRTREEKDIAAGHDEIGPHGVDDGAAAAHGGEVEALQATQARLLHASARRCGAVQHLQAHEERVLELRVVAPAATIDA